jgi:hypothetical protein
MDRPALTTACQGGLNSWDAVLKTTFCRVAPFLFLQYIARMLWRSSRGRPLNARDWALGLADDCQNERRVLGRPRSDWRKGSARASREQQDLWSREWLLRREFNREFAFEQPKIAAEIELSKAMRAAYAKERGVIEATLTAAKAAERQATIATRIAVAALLVGILALVFSVFLDLK